MLCVANYLLCALFTCRSLWNHAACFHCLLLFRNSDRRKNSNMIMKIVVQVNFLSSIFRCYSQCRKLCFFHIFFCQFLVYMLRVEWCIYYVISVPVSRFWGFHFTIMTLLVLKFYVEYHANIFKLQYFIVLTTYKRAYMLLMWTLLTHTSTTTTQNVYNF